MNRQTVLLVAAFLCFLVAMVILLGGEPSVLGASAPVWEDGGFMALVLAMLP